MTFSRYSRVRSRSEPNGTEDVVRTGYAAGTLGTYMVTSKSESMVDVVTPGYRQKIAAGGIVNNDCEYTKVETLSEGTGQKVSGLTSGTSKDNTVVGPITRYYIGAVVNTSDLQVEQPDRMSQAKFMALSNVDSTPYSFGEDLGEMRKTLEFLKNPLKSIFGMTKSMQRDLRRDFRQKTPRTRKQAAEYALNRAESMSDIYLSYRFGLSPLVRSAHDAIEALSYKVANSPERRTARGFANWSHSDSGTGTVTSSGNTDTYSKGYDISKKWRASILYEVSNPSFKWQRDLGLRGKDLPHTLWQLMPYSFMVDRVVDVSSAIRGLANLADPNVRILAASVVIKKDEQSWHQMTNRKTSGWHHEVVGEKRINKEFVYKRITYRPSFADTLPPINFGGLTDTATKLADLTTIIIKNLR